MKALAIAVAMFSAAAATPTDDWKLTPAGWGPVRIGMNRAQVEKTLKLQLEGEAFDNEGSCVELYGGDGALPGFYFMFLDGKLSRISIGAPSVAKTPRGMGIGSSADEVRAAYGEKLLAETHHYEGEPAEYLTYWLKPEKSGVRFETDGNLKVETIHAGDASIQYIEGCA